MIFSLEQDGKRREVEIVQEDDGYAIVQALIERDLLCNRGTAAVLLVVKVDGDPVFGRINNQVPGIVTREQDPVGRGFGCERRGE